MLAVTAQMNEVDELIPTRQSLLSRLKDFDDHESWRDFFETYWRLIFNTAVKAGLTEVEAQDVVQETVISVFKSMPGFKYDQTGSFKRWLLNLTRWRINDQARKRQPGTQQHDREFHTSTRPSAAERAAAPAGVALETIWDREWEQTLMEAALARVKRKVDAKHYQVFDLYVFKQWPVSRIARALGVNRGSVYLAKHRISKLLKKEILYLQSKPL